MDKNDKIYLAGHTGLVGSAILRNLQKNGSTNIIYQDEQNLDLTDILATDEFFNKNKPDYVFIAAAKVGGIHANNTFPADFIRINLQIQTNLIHSSHKYGVKKLLFLGSSCIYPKLALQPIKEECLLTDQLESTNDAYAIAKIAGIIMCKSYNKQYNTNFIAAMPTNLYGPGDNFDLKTSHVLPAMLRKFHEAKVNNKATVELWGTGTPKREFLYVDDLADALLFLMNNFEANKNEYSFLNVGTGKDISIAELAALIAKITGFKGKIIWNTKMPDGTPRKLLDITKLQNLGWQPVNSLKQGIEKTYKWYLENK